MLDWIIVVGQKSYRRPRHRLQKISGSRPAFGFLERKLENKIKIYAEANIYNKYIPSKEESGRNSNQTAENQNISQPKIKYGLPTLSPALFSHEIV